MLFSAEVIVRVRCQLCKSWLGSMGMESKFEAIGTLPLELPGHYRKSQKQQTFEYFKISNSLHYSRNGEYPLLNDVTSDDLISSLLAGYSVFNLHFLAFSSSSICNIITN